MPIHEALIEFATAVRADRSVGQEGAREGAALEPQIAPRFQQFLEAILPGIVGDNVRVLPEYTRAGIGRPDIAFVRAGNPPRAFIELKQPYLDLQPSRFTGHNKDQFERFCELPVWALCNFRRIQLYRRDELVVEAEILPLEVLSPQTRNNVATRMIRSQSMDGFEGILRTLANSEPPTAHNAEELARNLAYAARLIRSIVSAQCKAGLNTVAAQVRADFNEVLFARAEAGGYDASDMDALFSDAFAQTLIFGLLLARETANEKVDHHAHEMLDSSTYPLLRGTLRALTLDEVREILGIAFDVAFDAVNSVNPKLLSPDNGNDPVLYLYEDFLRVFDPAAVEKYGVYYTPPEIVQLIVAETDRALRRNLAKEGLLNSDVQLLDPACGTGTFLIAAANKVAELARDSYGPGAVKAEIAGFAQRMNGFELLVGPYTVSHYRMTRVISGYGGQIGRLPIFLADTLAAPAQETVIPHLDFLSLPMVAEREAADHIKTDAPILVVLGNPPYKRLKKGEVRRLVGQDMMLRWDDLKRPVRDAGLGRSLNAFPDLYVAFWRWALWRIFEAPGATGQGIVAYITNRTFLTGTGFGGLRKMLRERFDHIRIIDFRGDHRGALPATVVKDENVFNIETGVCVLVGIADGIGGDEDATIEYADVWQAGATLRAEKIALAREASLDGNCIQYKPVSGKGMDMLRPPGFPGEDWPSIAELFRFRSNGIVSYRDKFAYATSKNVLASRIQNWLTEPPDVAAKQFSNSDLNHAGDALAVPFDTNTITPVAYRPLDIRYLYAHPNYVDRLRPDLQNAWGTQNVAMMVRNDGTGKGPAAWCHGYVPDQHSFMGSGGGWIFPFNDSAAKENIHNLQEGVVSGMSEAYGREISPQALFDCVVALLSATGYTVRFARDLENDFPHIPFPADPELFLQVAKVGARIRKIETFSQYPAKKFRRARIEGFATEQILDVPAPSRAFTGAPAAQKLALRSEGSLFVKNVSQSAWDVVVSSKRRVLYSWLRARNGRKLNAELQREILDVVARIEELLYLFNECENLLEQALEATLSRAQIGLRSPSEEASAAT